MSRPRYFSVQLKNPKFKFRLETQKFVPSLSFFFSLELRADMRPNSSYCEGPAVARTRGLQK